METEELKSVPSQLLIPEKEANFSLEKGTYFRSSLEKVAQVLETSVTELMSWEDETVLISLDRAKIYPTKKDIHKILAYKNFNAENCYVSTPLEFSNIAAVVNDDIAITDLLEPIDSAYVAWTIELLERHDNNNEIEITDDVAHYVAMCFYEDGFRFLPESLQLFQEYLDSIYTSVNISYEDSKEKYDRIENYLELRRKELKE